MKAHEIIYESPRPGHTIDIEFGDLLIETEIVDVTEDGVVVHLDETAMELILDAKRQYVAEGFSTDPTQPGTWNGHRIVANRKTPKGSYLILQNKNDGKYEIHKQNPNAVGGLEFVSVHETSDEMQSAFKKLTGIDESNQGVAEGQDPGLRAGEDALLAILKKHNFQFRDGRYVQPNTGAIVSLLGGSSWSLKRPGQREITGFGPSDLGTLEYQLQRGMTAEAKYQGRTVQLGKRMKGDVKKFKVYVKNKKGNVIKVNFGQKGVKIKKNNPARRKSFRARHNCATAKDRTTPRYWSCRAW